MTEDVLVSRVKYGKKYKDNAVFLDRAEKDAIRVLILAAVMYRHGVERVGGWRLEEENLMQSAQRKNRGCL